VPQDLLDNIFIGVVFVIIVIIVVVVFFDIVRFLVNVFFLGFRLGFSGGSLSCGLLRGQGLVVRQKVGSLILVVRDGSCNCSAIGPEDAPNEKGSRTRHVEDELEVRCAMRRLWKCIAVCDGCGSVLQYATDSAKGLV